MADTPKIERIEFTVFEIAVENMTTDPAGFGIASSPRQRWGKVLVAEEEDAQRELSSKMGRREVRPRNRHRPSQGCQRVDDCTS